MGTATSTRIGLLLNKPHQRKYQRRTIYNITIKTNYLLCLLHSTNIINYIYTHLSFGIVTAVINEKNSYTVTQKYPLSYKIHLSTKKFSLIH